jgi:hypothetical protein
VNILTAWAKFRQKRKVDRLIVQHLETRVEELEAWAHPKCGIEGFDGYHELVERIKRLESK